MLDNLLEEHQTSISEDLKSAIETGVVTKRLASFLLGQFITFNNFQKVFREDLKQTLEIDTEELQQHCPQGLLDSLPPVDGVRCLCNAMLYIYKNRK